MKKQCSKKFIASALILTTLFSNTPMPCFADSKTTPVELNTESAYYYHNLSNLEKDLLSQNYDYSGLNDYSGRTKRSVQSKAVKKALIFIQKNWPKIVKVAEKYGIKLATGKGISSMIQDMLDGVIAVDENIDDVIYSIVDAASPDGTKSKTKTVLANTIRLMLPV